MAGRLWNSFKIAFTMYSRIPVPEAQWTEENTSYTMCFFPFIGAVIGAVTWGLFLLKEYLLGRGFVFGDFFFTVLMVLVPIFITGGIHLDGFMDTQDALGSWQPKEKRLEILKDSHAGSFAVLSCGVYLLAYIGVYSALTAYSVRVTALSFLLSRTLSGLSVLCFPQAREEGKSLTASFSAHAAKNTGRAVLGIYLVLLCFIIIAAGRYAGVSVILAAGLMYGYYYRMCIKKFGGMTGDLAGYFLQMCELFMAAAAVVTDVFVKGFGL